MQENSFNDLASVWWQTDGPMAALHDLNALRLAYIQQSTSLQQKHVLDIGCGGGILASEMATAEALVTGIDIAKNLIEVAQQHAQQHNLNIDYQHTCLQDFKKNQVFQIITCMELLEHVEDPYSIIFACAKLLDSGGELFISTISKTQKAFWLGIVAAEYLLGTVPKGSHQYNKFIRPAEMARMMRKAGLQVIKVDGVAYNPLTRVSKLTHSTDINYFMLAKKI